MWTSGTMQFKKAMLGFHTHQVPISLNIKEKMNLCALPEFRCEEVKLCLLFMFSLKLFCHPSKKFPFDIRRKVFFNKN